MSYEGKEESSQADEDKPLLPSERLNILEQERRDRYVIDAVQGLNYILLITAWTIIVALALVFVNEYTANIPVWSIFLVLWIGHFILFIVFVHMIRQMLRSLLAKNDAERLTQRWHQANERRIPLIQYLMFHLLWALGISFMLVIFEILLYLSLIDAVPSYVPLVPVYVVALISFSNSLVCR
jgi:hypothetical protein